MPVGAAPFAGGCLHEARTFADPPLDLRVVSWAEPLLGRAEALVGSHKEEVPTMEAVVHQARSAFSDAAKPANWHRHDAAARGVDDGAKKARKRRPSPPPARGGPSQNELWDDLCRTVRDL